MIRQSFFYKFYSALITLSARFQSFLLLAIRLYWGYSFFQGGQGKLKDIASVTSFFQSLGIPLAEFNAYAVASIELVGGLLLMLGLGTRLTAIPLVIVMVGAYATAHVESLKSAFDDPATFVKAPPFDFLLACLILFAFGPGKISVDYLLEKLSGRAIK